MMEKESSEPTVGEVTIKRQEEGNEDDKISKSNVKTKSTTKKKKKRKKDKKQSASSSSTRIFRMQEEGMVELKVTTTQEQLQEEEEKKKLSLTDEEDDDDFAEEANVPRDFPQEYTPSSRVETPIHVESQALTKAASSKNKKKSKKKKSSSSKSTTKHGKKHEKKRSKSSSTSATAPMEAVTTPSSSSSTTNSDTWKNLMTMNFHSGSAASAPNYSNHYQHQTITNLYAQQLQRLRQTQQQNRRRSRNKVIPIFHPHELDPIQEEEEEYDEDDDDQVANNENHHQEQRIVVFQHGENQQSLYSEPVNWMHFPANNEHSNPNFNPAADPNGTPSYMISPNFPSLMDQLNDEDDDTSAGDSSTRDGSVASSSSAKLENPPSFNNPQDPAIELDPPQNACKGIQEDNVGFFFQPAACNLPNASFALVPATPIDKSSTRSRTFPFPSSKQSLQQFLKHPISATFDNGDDLEQLNSIVRDKENQDRMQLRFVQALHQQHQQRQKQFQIPQDTTAIEAIIPHKSGDSPHQQSDVVVISVNNDEHQRQHHGDEAHLQQQQPIPRTTSWHMADVLTPTAADQPIYKAVSFRDVDESSSSSSIEHSESSSNPKGPDAGHSSSSSTSTFYFSESSPSSSEHERRRQSQNSSFSSLEKANCCTRLKKKYFGTKQDSCRTSFFIFVVAGVIAIGFVITYFALMAPRPRAATSSPDDTIPTAPPRASVLAPTIAPTTRQSLAPSVSPTLSVIPSPTPSAPPIQPQTGGGASAIPPSTFNVAFTQSPTISVDDDDVQASTTAPTSNVQDGDFLGVTCPSSELYGTHACGFGKSCYLCTNVLDDDLYICQDSNLPFFGNPGPGGIFSRQQNLRGSLAGRQQQQEQNQQIDQDTFIKNDFQYDDDNSAIVLPSVSDTDEQQQIQQQLAFLRGECSQSLQQDGRSCGTDADGNDFICPFGQLCIDCGSFAPMNSLKGHLCFEPSTDDIFGETQVIATLNSDISQAFKECFREYGSDLVFRDP